MMTDPFEVRMRFTTMLQHLSASVTSAQKAAQYALKFRDLDEDLHSCILEQLERNSMNTRANIMSFIEHFCDMATKENHPTYVRMIQRDIFRVIDAAVPPDGTGAANAKHVQRVINNLKEKQYLTAEVVDEINAALQDRDTDELMDLGGESLNDDSATSKAATPRSVPASGNGTTRAPVLLDKRQVEQRIEEDRERNKRLRENMWAIAGDDLEEIQKFVDELSDIGEDDFINAKEETEERERCGDLLLEQNERDYA
ncbi:hypothetical protein N7540_008670 [Penicillium herquei]|nr:hypothetical protein N7540_008670 [Penicillium herquei]